MFLNIKKRCERRYTKTIRDIRKIRRVYMKAVCGVEKASDALVTVDLDVKGIEIEIRSKIKAMFGKLMKKAVLEAVEELEVENAHIIVEDFGALDFIIKGRTITALKRAMDIKDEVRVKPKQTLDEKVAEDKKLRRTMLFAPANNAKLLFTTSIHKPDCIIFDLEDAVKVSEKDAARDLLAEALKVVDYEGCEVFARINPLRTPTNGKAPFGELDVRTLVPAGLRRMRLPMCETVEHIEELSQLLDELEEEHGIEKGSVKIQASLETVLGVANAREIAACSDRIISISFGSEDFTKSLGAVRTKGGMEIFFARTQIVMAAALAGVDAMDTVWADLGDLEGFKTEVESTINFGFTGKSCVHPSQVRAVHDMMTPSMEEVEKSLAIVNAAKEANIENGGVSQINGKMIDGPIIDKAQKIVGLAKGAGLIK